MKIYLHSPTNLYIFAHVSTVSWINLTNYEKIASDVWPRWKCGHCAPFLSCLWSASLPFHCRWENFFKKIEKHNNNNNKIVTEKRTSKPRKVILIKIAINSIDWTQNEQSWCNLTKLAVSRERLEQTEDWQRWHRSPDTRKWRMRPPLKKPLGCF